MIPPCGIASNDIPPEASVVLRSIRQQHGEMTMPPLLRIVLAESADLLVSTVKVTVVVTLLTVAILLLGWFFSSDLPDRAIMTINGR